MTGDKLAKLLTEALKFVKDCSCVTTKPFEMSDQARWKATVYVGGLASTVNAANLHAAFLPFGEISDVSLP